MSSPGRALLIAPLFLRLTLGATMLWTGMGLVSATFVPASEDIGVLENMKALRPVTSASDGPVPPKPSQEFPHDTARPDPTGPEPAGSPPLIGLSAPEPNSEALPRLYRIAMQSVKVASPESVGNARALWPRFAVDGEWPKFIAWSIAVASVVCGSMLIAGLFVRLCALLCCVFVATPMWLFLLAPAIQAGHATFGFLPAGGMWELDQAGQLLHAPLMWMMLQIAVCFSLAFSGAGFLSLDRALFSSGSGGPPVRKPAPKRPAPKKD